jgi:predicted enzyme related to lactoylglutathione lyase
MVLKKIFLMCFISLFIILIHACTDSKKIKSQNENAKPNMPAKFNPVVYFEIPVTNMPRAIAFYKAVFNFTFEVENIDNNEMALFPFTETSSGISGALAKGEIYKPTKDGVLIYFKTENIEHTLQLATDNGAKILYPETNNGIGLVAEFEDTEGNRIALFQSIK